ncbi:MAG: LytR/AlgR family response regulator transcription factor [Flavobacteriaceae bacterium]
MKSYRCLILDDDELAIKLLEKQCENSDLLNIEKTFTDALEGLKYLKNHSDIDLIFLDIHMPKISGMDIVDMISDDILIVFTTGDVSMAVQAFNFVNVLDYMIKPINKERIAFLETKLQRFENSEPKESKKNSLFVSSNQKLIRINPDDIFYIEGKGDYILIVTVQDRVLVHSTLKSMLQNLREDVFFQTHRSYIVNLDKVNKIENNSINMLNRIIPISRASKSEFFKRIGA